MNVVADRRDPDQGVWSIDNLDFPLTWGPLRAGADDLSAYVCAGSMPVKVWMIAEVEVPCLLAKDGGGVNKASLKLNLLREADRYRINDILQNLPHPRPDIIPSDLWLGKIMAKKSTEKWQIPLFNQLFDARKTITNGVKRPIDLDLVKKNDIVMVEFLISRWRIRDDAPPEDVLPKPKKFTRGRSNLRGKRTRSNNTSQRVATSRPPQPIQAPPAWTKWTVNLDLKTVYLLFTAPPMGDVPGDVADTGANF